MRETDLISRQAAIETALEFVVEYLGGAFVEDLQIELKKRIEGLPSAQPERQTGRWIDIPHTFFCKCSECGWINDHDSGFKWCPDCGADMRGE